MWPTANKSEKTLAGQAYSKNQWSRRLEARFTLAAPRHRAFFCAYALLVGDAATSWPRPECQPQKLYIEQVPTP